MAALPDGKVAPQPQEGKYKNNSCNVYVLQLEFLKKFCLGTSKTQILPIYKSAASFCWKAKITRFSVFNLSFQYAVLDSGLSQVP